MRLLGFLFILVSNVGFTQTNSIDIFCPGSPSRYLRAEANRIAVLPEKLSPEKIETFALLNLTSPGVIKPFNRQELPKLPAITKEIIEFELKLH